MDRGIIRQFQVKASTSDAAGKNVGMASYIFNIAISSMFYNLPSNNALYTVFIGHTHHHGMVYEN
jgi:hypothetical protein